MRNNSARKEIKEIIRDSALPGNGDEVRPFHPDEPLRITYPNEIIDIPKMLDDLMQTREEVDFWLADKTSPSTIYRTVDNPI